VSTDEPSVLVDHCGAIATITLNRPQRRNGLTVEMCAALYEAVRGVATSDARVVILRGAGHDFCVGADLHGGADINEGAEAEPHGDLGPIHHAATLLHTMPQVTIAAIDGGCAGAGLGYAAACDLRFASSRARFASAFLNVGVSGDMGLAWSLHQIVGPARARELLLLPGKFDAERALAIGLVSALHPAESHHTEVLALAERLCDARPLALRLMKANALSAETLPLAGFIDIETERHLRTVADAGLGHAGPQGN
jgi:2-(1,2-epoxy-1,2-dihydrophenyl)acetyl-CoA isomerase